MARLRPRFTNDLFFKLFTRHPKLLKNLVANLLGVSVKNIGSFEIRNPEIPPESLGDKFCRLDIAMTVDAKRVSLEIQVLSQLSDNTCYPDSYIIRADLENPLKMAV